MTFIPQFPDYFDSSMLASFKSCPEKFRKEYIEHWKGKQPSVHLHAGGAFAKGLEVARRTFYEGNAPAEVAIAEGLGALLTAYGSFECPEDSAKSASRMAGAFEYYFSQYGLSHEEGPIELPGGKKGIEFSFAHPIDVLHPVTGNPLLYVGRMDAIYRTMGGVFIIDEKTTSQLGQSWSRQWDLRSQFTGYAWGCSKSNIHVDGAIVRGVSILKTKYDTQQAISYRPEWQLERWYEELLDWVEDIKLNWLSYYENHNSVEGLRRPFRHNLDHSCAEYGGCGFREACSSQDEAPWLEMNFERRIWNPLLREEKKL
jgi:hypothetical protein